MLTAKWESREQVIMYCANKKRKKSNHVCIPLWNKRIKIDLSQKKS